MPPVITYERSAVMVTGRSRKPSSCSKLITSLPTLAPRLRTANASSISSRV